MATTPNYDINYDDQRFQTVEAEKQAAIENVNNTYNSMINQSDTYYQAQIDAAKDYANTQQQIQQQNTDLTIEQINQQKDQAQKDYTKEQAGAYVDWQKQSNQFGANAEAMAAQGLANTGFSESSQVSMYNTYQNRVATARDTFNRAVLNYDNSIKEAQLANNAALAEIAFNALQTQLELSLAGFQYKNDLLQTQLQMQNETEDRYYSRWQDVLAQMNQENQFAESVRQYEQDYKFQQEQFAEQKRQFNEEVRQYEQNYQLQVKQFNEEIRQFNEEIARLKAQDKAENEYKIKQLELQKQQLAQQKAEAERNYQLKQKELAQQQAQWQAEYNLAKQKASPSGGGGGGGGGNDAAFKKDPDTSNEDKKNPSSSGTVKVKVNGKTVTAYSTVGEAYRAIGGGSPYGAQRLLDEGYVKMVAYNGKTYYYGVTTKPASNKTNVRDLATMFVR